MAHALERLGDEAQTRRLTEDQATYYPSKGRREADPYARGGSTAGPVTTVHRRCVRFRDFVRQCQTTGMVVRRNVQSYLRARQ